MMEDTLEMKASDAKEDRAKLVELAIHLHREACLRYNMARGIDRQLWEVLDNE
jgi:hypothetical protein